MFTEEQAERLVQAFEKIAASLILSVDEIQMPAHAGAGIVNAILYLATSIEDARPDTETLSAEIANIANQVSGIPQALEQVAASMPS